MKSSTIGMTIPVNKNELDELLNDTPETLAAENQVTRNYQRFGTLEMWNLRKRQRTTQQMRRWLN